MNKTPATIAIEEIRVHAYHGVYPIEKREGHTFQVDIYLFTDIYQATQTDELEDTVDYKQVYDLIISIVKEPVKLLEHLADKICQEILKTYPTVDKVNIRVSKFHPLSMEKCLRTYVELKQMRNQPIN